MEVKPGYRQTEVGVIPEEWEVLPFKEQFNISAGGDVNPKLSSLEQDDIHRYPIYSNALTDRGLYGYCSYADHPAHSITITARGTLGVATYRDHKYTAIGRVLVLEPKRQSAGQFLAEFINSRVKFAIESTGVPQLTAPQISGYRLVVPPYPEQLAIAEALSDVDALLGALDRLIAKKRNLKQAAMQQLLTGQTRLPGFHGEWEVVCMREVLAQNATYGIVTAGTFVQNGVKMLRGGDIVDGRINTDLPMVSCEKAAEYGRTVLVNDDVVIALVGYPGASAKIPEQLIGANISRAVGLLRLNGKVSADFLVCFLNSTDGRRMVLASSAGSAQQVVNLAALNKLQFTIPPLPEQTAIAEVLTDMDEELAALEQRREKTRVLKQAMMQELLTGKTRLV